MTTTGLKPSIDTAREDIFIKVRSALRRCDTSPVRPIPPSARVAPRVAGNPEAEMALLLSEIEKLTGVTRWIKNQAELETAFRDLVAKEQVKKASMWSTPEFQELGIAGILSKLGVELVPCHFDKWKLGECELGVTGVDIALPETGTLVLRSTADRPRMVSLLPRVHLALLRRSALRPDLRQALAEVKDDGTFVLISGPSRTADIELTLTLGVHGPKSLFVWVMED